MKKVLALLSCLLLLFEGCSKDIDDFPKSNLRAISNFSIKPYLNGDNNIFVEHKGVIDEVNKEIKVSLPAETDLKGLRPDISLSPWTTVSPGNLSPMDFDTPVELTVTAESGKVAVYTVNVTKDYLYTYAELYSVILPDFKDGEGVSLSGAFLNYADNVSTTIKVPAGTDLTQLKMELNPTVRTRYATFEVSEDGGNTYEVFPGTGIVNGSQEVVFRVTSQSKKNVIRYKVTVIPEEIKNM